MDSQSLPDRIFLLYVKQLLSKHGAPCSLRKIRRFALIFSARTKEPDIDEITISYKRKKKSGKREADLSDLPTRIFNHTLSEEELNEKFPEGYYELPAKVYKRLFIIPETFIVDEHHVHTYKSKGADGTIIKANRPADVFRNSIVLLTRSPAGLSTPPIVLFDWEPRRTPDYPREFLSEFLGTIVTDGYQVYHKIASERDDLKVAGCWIHARRKYAEIIKSLGDKASKDSIAKQAYDMITKIMHEDNKYDSLTKKDREKNRKLILKPMVNDCFASPHSIYYRP